MNIFEVLNVNYEIFHSRMLAWLLDAGGSHLAGDRFQKAVLNLVGLPQAEAGVWTEVMLRVPHQQRWRLGDIVLRTSSHLVLLENKVDPSYIDPQQIVDEIAGGQTLAESEGRQFLFVFLSPTELTGEHAGLLGSTGRCLAWATLLSALEGVAVDDLDPFVATILKQYHEFCANRFARPSREARLPPGGSDDVLVKCALAIRDQLQSLDVGALATAFDLWPEFCARYPDHVDQLESRWAESSQYSARAWYASRLQLLASKSDLLRDTGEWRLVDPSWGFNRVRVYQRI